MSDQQSLDPNAAAAIARVRRMMIVVMTATFVAIGLVLAAIGYRISQTPESNPTFADIIEALPAGAKVVSTAIANDHILVTIEVNGVTELLTFDPDTLKPLGRLKLEPKH